MSYERTASTISLRLYRAQLRVMASEFWKRQKFEDWRRAANGIQIIDSKLEALTQ